jgi:hypothetical protein
MKCVGFDRPPCDRCAKVGRDCLPQQYIRNRPQRQSSRDLVPVSDPDERPHLSEHWATSDVDSNLPSIYSASPLQAVLQASPSDGTYDALGSKTSKRRRLELSDGPISKRDMLELIILFVIPNLLVDSPV